MSFVDKRSDFSDKDIKSISSAQTLSGKDRDTIPFRIETIQNMLQGSKLDSLVDFDNCDTEAFIMSKQFSSGNDSDNSKDSKDPNSSIKKQTKNFCKIIKKMGGSISYVKSGTSGHIFQGGIAIDENSTLDYGVKVVAYPKNGNYGNIYDPKRPENAELAMIKLLSYFVVKKQTPHIVLPICTFNTSIKPFIKILEDDNSDDADDKSYIKNNEKYNDFVERYKNNEFYDQVSILISEWANRGDLLDFIRRMYKTFKPYHWKVLFFQVISTLAVIQSKFPSFRHNDLKANNILIHKINKNSKNPKFLYKVVKSEYRVNNIGYLIKLWDFDFACIPGIVDNAKVECAWTTKINVTPDQNRYYDVHYFFNTLIKKGFFPQFMTEDCIPQEAKDFVNRIVPPKYQTLSDCVHKRGRILVQEEYLTPDEILKTDPYFEEFRKQKSSTTRSRTRKLTLRPSSNTNTKTKSKSSSIRKTSGKTSTKTNLKTNLKTPAKTNIKPSTQTKSQSKKTTDASPFITYKLNKSR